jgi:thiamine pyrophosphate-dependent acetolactate synthase large subunit-like protein
MPVFYLDALTRHRADSEISITQITHYITANFSSQLSSQIYSDRWQALQKAHAARLEHIESISQPLKDNTFGTSHLCRVLRKVVPKDSIFAIEAVTNTVFVADALQATFPGSWINCGGGGLGWSGGGALGVKLASEYESGGKGKFVVQIVGDGTFLFSVPGSVYWISQRYNIPVLTIVLNNKG